METLSFTLSNVVGPPLTGLLISLVDAPYILLFDALSCFLFAIALLGMRLPSNAVSPASERRGVSFDILQAARILLREPVLLATTLMFMAINIGLGAMLVWLPVYSDQLGEDGPKVYGLLLGILALGEVISALLAGSLKPSWPLGSLIATAQILAGASLLLLLFDPMLSRVVPGLFLLGFFTSPLTIWAQTVRMRIIPPQLRGRTFALLRTLMQAAIPIGGAAPGFMLPVLGVATLIGLSAGVIGLPGIIGSQIGPLRKAGAQDYKT